VAEARDRLRARPAGGRGARRRRRVPGDPGAAAGRRSVARVPVPQHLDRPAQGSRRPGADRRARARHPRNSARRCAAGGGGSRARGLPLPRAEAVHRGRPRPVLRARGVRRAPARDHAAPALRGAVRPLGQRQVVGGARGPVPAAARAAPAAADLGHGVVRADRPAVPRARRRADRHARARAGRDRPHRGSEKARRPPGRGRGHARGGGRARAGEVGRQRPAAAGGGPVRGAVQPHRRRRAASRPGARARRSRC